MGKRRRKNPKRLVLILTLGTDNHIQFFDYLRHIHFGNIQRCIAALNLIHIQHVINQPQQMLACGVNPLGILQNVLRVMGFPGKQGD